MTQDNLLPELRVFISAVASQFDEWKMEREPLGRWYEYNAEMRANCTAFMSRIGAVLDASAQPEPDLASLQERNRRLEEGLRDFLVNPLFQVAVGGNPNAVEEMLARNRALLSEDWSPASVATLAPHRDAKQGSVRSKGSAVPSEETADAQPIDGQD